MQNKSLFQSLEGYKTVSLVGLSKGAGKTTVLIHLIGRYADEKEKKLAPLAITSIGQGNALPEIYIRKGMLCATAESLLKHCDFTKKIVHTTGMNTPLGQVVVTEALSDGKVLLAGPTMNSQLESLCEYFKTQHDVFQILIDGANDRKTFSAPEAAAAVILCAGGGIAKTIDNISDEIFHTCTLAKLPKANSGILDSLLERDSKIREKEIDGFLRVFVSGALTENILKKILEGKDIKKLNVIAEDFTKIFIGKDLLDKFIYKGGLFSVVRTVNLVAVTLNPYYPGHEYDRLELMKTVKERLHGLVPVYDVMEREE